MEEKYLNRTNRSTQMILMDVLTGEIAFYAADDPVIQNGKMNLKVEFRSKDEFKDESEIRDALLLASNP